jgi:hypothetical protein
MSRGAWRSLHGGSRKWFPDKHRRSRWHRNERPPPYPTVMVLRLPIWPCVSGLAPVASVGSLSPWAAVRGLAADADRPRMPGTTSGCARLAGCRSTPGPSVGEQRPSAHGSARPTSVGRS